MFILLTKSCFICFLLFLSYLVLFFILLYFLSCLILFLPLILLYFLSCLALFFILFYFLSYLVLYCFNLIVKTCLWGVVYEYLSSTLKIHNSLFLENFTHLDFALFYHDLFPSIATLDIISQLLLHIFLSPIC